MPFGLNLITACLWHAAANKIIRGIIKASFFPPKAGILIFIVVSKILLFKLGLTLAKSSRFVYYILLRKKEQKRAIFKISYA